MRLKEESTIITYNLDIHNHEIIYRKGTCQELQLGIYRFPFLINLPNEPVGLKHQTFEV